VNELKVETDEHDLRSILKRYVQAEDATLALIASEIQSVPGADEQTRLHSKERILKEIELHARADLLVEDAVARYREDLYFISKRLSEEDGESGIITGHHVRQAQGILNRKRRQYSLGDVGLAIGGLFAGAGVPQLLQNKVPGLPEVACAVLGALLLGMGVVSKVKGQ